MKRPAGITWVATTMWAPLMLSCICTQTAFADDAQSSASQKTITDEVVRVANKFIDHGPCEPSRAEPSVVATMIPYTSEVAAGRATAKFAVVWSGDMGCQGGSGTNTMNILLVEKHGTDAPRIAGVDSIENVDNVQRIVAATPETLTVDVYTWAEDDAQPVPLEPGERKIPTARSEH